MAELPTTHRAAGDRLETKRLVGLPLAQARKLSSRYRCAVRVMRENGHDLIGDADFAPARVDVATRNGTVTAILTQ